MKLMSKLFKKNNKGLSLVELICAIAILGLSTTAIGGAMVMSARHYQKDSAEFTIQQEAQLVTNQVGNLVVDAAEADWDSTNKKLTIQSDNKKHVIYQSGDKLLYEQYDNSNVKISDGVLAEGVATNGFSVDDSAFDSNKNVNISLTLDKDGRNIKADYNATSRNGKLADYEQAQQVAVISMEDVIVIEPQMTVANNKPYKAEIRVNGMTWEEVGGVILDSSTSVPNGFKVEIKPEGGKYYLFVEAEQNAGGSFPVYLKTVNTKADANPLAEKQITVKVRRVNNLSITGPASGNITLGLNNTEYVLTAEATGDNLTKGFGFKYDDAPYDYVNPQYVDFVVECPVDHEVVETGDVDNPSVWIKLNANMEDGQQIKVTAYSKHAYQGNNKSGIAYDTSANVMKQYIIECDRPTLPPVTFPSDIERGMDFTWNSDLANTVDKSALEAKYGTVTNHWYVRFKPEGGSWTPYNLTVDAGTAKKFHGNNETLVMLPNKAYTIELILVYMDANNKVVWPQDDDLLQQDGFNTGNLKGWNDADATITDISQYGGSHDIPAAVTMYYNNSGTSEDDGINVPSGEYALTCSNVFSISGKNGMPNGTKINFDVAHLAKGQSSESGVSFTYSSTVWKRVGGSWDKLEADEVNELFTIEKDPNGEGANFTIKNLSEKAQTDDKKDALVGEYRFGINVSGAWYDYADSSTIFNRVFEDGTGTWPLYDTSKDGTPEEKADGFFYFTIVK